MKRLSKILLSLLLVLFIIVSMIIYYNRHKKIIELKYNNINHVNSIRYKDISGYTIIKSKKELNKIIKSKKIKPNFNKYKYIVLTMDRGASCDADIKITSVKYKNKKLYIDYKLFNIASGCKRSSPRNFLIEIDNNIPENIKIITKRK